MKPLAEAFKAYLIDNGQGGFLLSTAAEAEDASAVPANKLKIGEALLDLQQANGTVQVSLEDFAKSMNAKVIQEQTAQDHRCQPRRPRHGAASTPGAAATPPKPAGNVLRIYGKITLPGANQVGLFEGGSSSTPYTLGSVDSRGNYTMDIDLDKDMHPHGGRLWRVPRPLQLHHQKRKAARARSLPGSQVQHHRPRVRIHRKGLTPHPPTQTASLS